MKSISTHAFCWFIFLPFFGVELSRFVFELFLGRWWYITSSERSALFGLGVIISLMALFFSVGIPKIKKKSIIDVVFFLYLCVYLVSLCYSTIKSPFDFIYIKQLFIFFSILMAYLYGRYDKFYLDLNLMQKYCFVLLLVDVLLTLFGVYPNSSAMFLVITLLVVIATKKQNKKIYLISLVLLLSVFMLGINNINRTFMLWSGFFIVGYILFKTNFQGYYKFISRFSTVLVGFLLLVGMLSIDIPDDTKSTTLIRIAGLSNLIKSDGSSEMGVALSDRTNEINDVKLKYAVEADIYNYLFGFGASGRYDSYRVEEVIYNHHHVHVGIYSEYLKRGFLGVFIFGILNLIVMYFTFRLGLISFKKVNSVWVLSWFYMLGVIFWFTWAEMFFNYIYVWMYMGVLSTLILRKSDNGK